MVVEAEDRLKAVWLSNRSDWSGRPNLSRRPPEPHAGSGGFLNLSKSFNYLKFLLSRSINNINNRSNKSNLCHILSQEGAEKILAQLLHMVRMPLSERFSDFHHEAAMISWVAMKICRILILSMSLLGFFFSLSMAQERIHDKEGHFRYQIENGRIYNRDGHFKYRI